MLICHTCGVNLRNRTKNCLSCGSILSDSSPTALVTISGSSQALSLCVNPNPLVFERLVARRQLSQVLGQSTYNFDRHSVVDATPGNPVQAPEPQAINELSFDQPSGFMPPWAEAFSCEPVDSPPLTADPTDAQPRFGEAPAPLPNESLKSGVTSNNGFDSDPAAGSVLSGPMPIFQEAELAPTDERGRESTSSPTLHQSAEAGNHLTAHAAMEAPPPILALPISTGMEGPSTHGPSAMAVPAPVSVIESTSTNAQDVTSAIPQPVPGVPVLSDNAAGASALSVPVTSNMPLAVESPAQLPKDSTTVLPPSADSLDFFSSAFSRPVRTLSSSDDDFLCESGDNQSAQANTRLSEEPQAQGPGKRTDTLETDEEGKPKIARPRGYTPAKPSGETSTPSSEANSIPADDADEDKPQTTGAPARRSFSDRSGITDTTRISPAPQEEDGQKPVSNDFLKKEVSLFGMTMSRQNQIMLVAILVFVVLTTVGMLGNMVVNLGGMISGLGGMAVGGQTQSQSQSLSGKWAIHVLFNGRMTKGQIDLVQSGSTIGGEGTDSGGPFVFKGSLSSANRVAFAKQYRLVDPNTNQTTLDKPIVYVGKLEPNGNNGWYARGIWQMERPVGAFLHRKVMHYQGQWEARLIAPPASGATNLQPQIPDNIKMPDSLKEPGSALLPSQMPTQQVFALPPAGCSLSEPVSSGWQ